MKNFDLMIIGGGMVGLALAASLRDSPLRIAVVEGFPPQTPIERVMPRVSALNPASRKLLEELDVWQELRDLRITPYARMEVWEKDGFARIEFGGESLGLDHLGYIAENHLIRHLLWRKVEGQKNSEILTALPQRLEVDESHALISLSDNRFLTAKLAVGADGANSWLRRQADIPLTFRDYGHHALVCNVETAKSHRYTARQIFAADSILAFLPLHQANLCSIVWSLPPERARFLAGCGEDEFNETLASAFENRLGTCRLVSQRQTFPLTARYARDFARARIALVGDAAHTIHPLAGLGVNSGFQDAVHLARRINENMNAGTDIGNYRALRDYERHRKTDAVKMLVAMQGLKDLFSGTNPLKKLVRGIGLNVTNRLGIVKEQLIKQATGL